ncbi:tRNA lysidine(34) synthetase TilS [Consotaella aegiceratis]|uniref:tRNA lysidine(34) synthetase TilS n=1 Tax=Consotaella aegiceratis TaxID=3097961 RepID=UPI002F3F8660
MNRRPPVAPTGADRPIVPSTQASSVAVEDAALEAEEAFLFFDASLKLLRARRSFREASRPEIVLAVSGGPDSLAMMVLAAASAARLETRFHVVTIDHGLRAESSEEARFVAAMAASLGLSHETRRWERGGPVSGNLQAEAREARYRLLAEAARERGAVAIVTAHHQDDQIETHLIARTRRAGPRGLAAMRPIRDLDPGLSLLRPFLQVPRVALEATLRRRGLDFVRDPSNRDMRFLRARIRRSIEATSQRQSMLDVIEENRRRQNALEAHLRESLLRWRETGALAVSPEGVLTLGRGAFADLSAELAAALLERILLAVGGGAYPPPRAATERLGHRLQTVGGAGRWTLAGATIAAGEALVFMREFGRRGPDELALEDMAGKSSACRFVFDNRFDLDLADAASGAGAVVAFGRLGKGNPVERTLPVLMDKRGEPLAAHPTLLAKLPPGTRRLALAERVSWRLTRDLDIAWPRSRHHPKPGAP